MDLKLFGTLFEVKCPDCGATTNVFFPVNEPYEETGRYEVNCEKCEACIDCRSRLLEILSEEKNESN